MFFSLLPPVIYCLDKVPIVVRTAQSIIVLASFTYTVLYGRHLFTQLRRRLHTAACLGISGFLVTNVLCHKMKKTMSSATNVI